MSIIRLLGSFPNSQIKPTSAVRDTDITTLAVAASPGETKVLVANEDRITATFKNAGAFNIKYDTQAGQALAEGMTIEPGRTFSVEGADVEVWATSVGGAGSLELQDERG